MILTFADANRTYDPEHQCVRFAGHGDDFEVSFELETRALRKMDPNAPVDEHSMLAVFDACRSRIEQVAQAAYARQKGQALHLLWTTDFSPPFA